MHLPDTSWSDRFFLFLGVGTALFALWMHYGIYETRVSRAEWAKPSQHIRQHFKKGDVVALLPHWALMGAEKLNGLPVLYAEKLEKEDLSRHKRLWVLMAPRLGKWWFRKAFRPIINELNKRYWLRESKQFGALELYLFQLPPSQPMLYDFLARKTLKQAEVSLETPATARPARGCPSLKISKVQWIRRWRDKPGWFVGSRNYRFGRIIQEIGDTPRDCLWAQPKRCKVLRVRYRNVPMQGMLRLQHGFTTATPSRGVTPTVKPSGVPVEIEVWAENRFLKKYVVSQKQQWRTHFLNLSGRSFPFKKGSVEFRIKVPGMRTGRTGYCFKAVLRDVSSKK